MNYTFILDLTPGIIGLAEDNCMTSGETSKFGNLVHLILEILWYVVSLLGTEMRQEEKIFPHKGEGTPYREVSAMLSPHIWV